VVKPKSGRERLMLDFNFDLLHDVLYQDKD